jgi:hypothetical protein
MKPSVGVSVMPRLFAVSLTSAAILAWISSQFFSGAGTAAPAMT